MTCAVASTVAAQEEYSMPSDYLRMECVFLNRTPDKLKLTPIRVTQRDPRASQGVPERYWIWGLNVSSVNSLTIGLNPVPLAAGTSDLHIYYRQLPLTMVAAGQAPEIPIQWQDALVSYAVWKTYRRRGREWAQMAREAQTEWEEWLKRARRYSNPLMTDVPTQVLDTGGYHTWGGD